METKPLTRSEVLVLVPKLWQEFLDKKDYDTKEVLSLVATTNADVQTRDWLLGLPNEVSSEGISDLSTTALCAEFISSLGLHATNNDVPQKDLVPFMAILSLFFIELGEQDEAMTALMASLQNDPDYPLSQLVIKHLMVGAITAEQVIAMRNTSHPKVCEKMKENA